MNDRDRNSERESRTEPRDVVRCSSPLEPEYAQRVELREPSSQFRESVERNLRIGRAAASKKKK
jgi:hypothetical protein